MKYIVLLLVCLSFLFSTATNRALIVGIGGYDTDKTGWEKLHGDKDVDLLKESLLKVGFEKENIKTLKNKQATKSAILKSLKRLESEVKAGDFIIFHFSGHGQPVMDLNGDESNGRDEAIVAYDAYRSPRYKMGNSFYQGENHLIDDELNPIFNEIKKKIGKKGYFLVTIDACYSRGIEMDALGDLTPEEQKIAGNARGTDHVFKATDNSWLKTIPLPEKYSSSNKMTVISACREDERNFEYKKPNSNEVYGSLSYALVNLLNKGYSFLAIEKYFKKGEYVKDKIFVSVQHPKIVVY